MTESPQNQCGPSDMSRRRSARIVGPIPVRVIGNDAKGVAFGEDAITVCFNKQGARISLTHSLLVDDIILILNHHNGIEEEFRVVGALCPVIGERAEWGVEAVNPDGKIWGIEFSKPSEDLQPIAVIECGSCKRVIQTELSSIEYDVLLAVGMISRNCTRCNETTRWKPKPDVVQSDIEAVPRAATVTPERRAVKRIKLVMRVRVRNPWGVTDVAQTRDVSKTGLCFLSNNVYGVGEEVFVVLPFAANSIPVETRGRIEWSSPTPAGRYYGVIYIK